MNSFTDSPPQKRITRYSFGNITVDGKTYSRDVIIYPDEVFSPWWRSKGHLLQLEDLQQVIQRKIPILVVGTGASGVMRVPEPLIKELALYGMEVKVQPTYQAVNTYNHIEAGGGKAAAALHLTC
jgi:hypothetical protein